MSLGRTNINLPEIPPAIVIIEDEFQGTTLNTDLWTWRASGNESCVVNNGLTISNNSTLSKVSYLQLNKLFTGKEKRITVNATVTGLTGDYKEGRISMFTGQDPATWEDSSLTRCGISFNYNSWQGTSIMVTVTGSIVSSGGNTRTDTQTGHSLSFPELWRIEADLENGKVTTYAGGDKMHEGPLPSNMELAIGKPFLFISTQNWYTNSISLANVTVVIE